MKRRRQRTNLTLRTKLIASYLLLILLPMSVLGGFSFVNIERMLIEQSSTAYREAVRQTTLNIRSVMEGYQSSANVVVHNQRLLNALRILRVRALTPGEEYDYYQQISAASDAALVQKGIETVRLAVDGDATFISDLFNVFPRATFENDRMYPAIASSGNYIWLRSAQFDTMRVSRASSFQLCTRIVDIYYQNASLGYLIMEVDEAPLFEAMQALHLPENAFLILHDGTAPIYRLGTNLPSVEESAKLYGETRDEWSAEIMGTSYLTLQRGIGLQGWHLLLAIPTEQLLSHGNSLPVMILLMALLLSIAAVTFALLLTHGNNRRLQTILQGIHRLEDGELGITMPVPVEDEYGRIQSAFNSLSLRMKTLVSDLLETQQKQKQAEQRLLYEQINPHFVYNTLDVIRWEAIRNEATPLAELADTLVGYLRLSLNHGQELIDVAGEIGMLDKYMHIMNYRYQNSIDFSTDIAPGMERLPMIKMILQPLVENAVLHGVMGRRERKGRIVVKGWLSGDAMLFTVTDDGAGMTPEQLGALLVQNEQHYGLWNVQQRLQSYYGPGSGLIFESAPGHGCTVTVSMRLENLPGQPAQPTNDSAHTAP